MIGNPDLNDNNFNLENYENFYEHHHFEPIPEEYATTINEVIPRFGWALDQVEELEAKNLLDLGCLDGSFALSVAAQLGLTVTGIDLTQDGIALAKERATKFKLPATFYQGEVEKHLVRLAKEGKQYDVVTWFELIEHVKDVPLVIKLIDAVLAPGGSVLTSTPAFESPYFGMDDEANTCHIRLYTMKEEDYYAVNKFGTKRLATSIVKEIGKDRIKDMALHNELINVRYQ